MPSELALLSTLIGSNNPCLEIIFMVLKVFEPLKFDCMSVSLLFFYILKKREPPLSSGYRAWSLSRKSLEGLETTRLRQPTTRRLSAKLAVNEYQSKYVSKC